MADAAEVFLSSFNRIEKWMREELDNPQNMGFSQMVRVLSKKEELSVKKYENDLLQISQLRNAIVHEQIGEDFVIAEPNEWIVKRILKIEEDLSRPQLVLPLFAKKVTGFEQDLPLTELLKIVANKRHSQFPLYKKGVFQGLITLKGLGYWFAKESQKGDLQLAGRSVKELISEENELENYAFVSATCRVSKVETMFHSNPRLDAIFITKDGDPNGNLLGIIRPQDVFNL